jgi:transcriptional accessory protein Tex/SPT6
MEMNPLASETIEIEENSALNDLKRKMKFTGTVIKTTLAGAVVDIGVSVPGVVHISQLSTEPVNRVEDVVKEGQTVEVWIRRVVPKKNRIELTMVKPLDLEWREIEKDMVLRGKVVRLEKFGAFVDIGAERPGLVHISEITHDYIKTPGDYVKEGDEVDVKVLSVNRQKRQIKLSMKALEEPPVKVVKVKEERSSRPTKESGRSAAVEEEPKEPPVPTAMEIAFREAMERNDERTDEQTGKAKKAVGQQDEMEKILSRTLEQRRK